MKCKITVILTALTVGLLTSCATNFYQVYQVTPTANIEANENYLIFEDENCKVSYDLWSNGGNIGFRCFNKTDEDIYLDLEKSYFILNGTAYNYYKNRVFTKSISSGSSESRSLAASKSLTDVNHLIFTTDK